MKRTNWLEELLTSLPPALEKPPEGDPDPWSFHPDRDSLADMIEALEILCRYDIHCIDRDDEHYERMADGLAWLRIAVGLDFSDLQARWNEIDLIPVEKHVSDKYLDNPRGVFACLDQIRLAYIVGADLAAIAMCRTTAELLIRRHYASDIPDADDSEKTGLTSLISQVQARPKLEFLRKPIPLIDKVQYANKILHARMLGGNVQEIRGHDQLLVRSWLKLLEQMIEEAPPGSPDSLPSPVPSLTHIIDAIERIRSETAGVSQEAFEADWRKRWLVERGVEIISEASRHLSEELKARYPKIPWEDVAGIGNKLRYHYDHIKPDVLWNVARSDLRPLETACRKELATAGV
jgi:uncharacterized protein with HEPN domain